MKRTTYRRCVPVVTSPVQVKEKSPKRVPDVESEEDPEEDLQEDSEKEGEPKKKRLKKASESDSNTLPPDYSTPNKETETNLDSTARCEAKPKELENTCESSVRSKHDSPQTIPTYILPDYPFRRSPIPFIEMAPTRRSNPNNGANPDIAMIIAQQLQGIIPQIVTQVTNNVNNANANGGNGNGGNGNGGNVLKRWIEKMESVMDISGCVNNQKVRYASSSLINKALTWWNTQIQARGHEDAMGMTWEEFKALFVEEFCPSNEIEKLETEFWNHAMVGANHAAYNDRFHELEKLVSHLVTPESKRIERALTDKAVRCGTLSKSSEKRKEVVESSKQGGSWNDNKRVKVGKAFAAAVPTRNEYAGSHLKCAKCFAYHPEGGPCRLCYNCQKPSHFARYCRAPVKHVAPINVVRMGSSRRACYECGSPDHFSNNYPKLNRAPG
ncbi:reverse transcriptase domain-containing protein [Tanacetum coccineum]